MTVAVEESAYWKMRRVALDRRIALGVAVDEMLDAWLARRARSAA
jgi:hypothetical protein